MTKQISLFLLFVCLSATVAAPFRARYQRLDRNRQQNPDRFNTHDEGEWIVETDGGYIVAASTHLAHAPEARKSLWLYKIDANGNRGWSTVFDFAEYQQIFYLSEKQAQNGEKYLVALVDARYMSGIDPRRGSLWILKVRSNNGTEINRLEVPKLRSRDYVVNSVSEGRDGRFLITGKQTHGEETKGWFAIINSSGGEPVSWTYSWQEARHLDFMFAADVPGRDYASLVYNSTTRHEIERDRRRVVEISTRGYLVRLNTVTGKIDDDWESLGSYTEEHRERRHGECTVHATKGATMTREGFLLVHVEGTCHRDEEMHTELPSLPSYGGGATWYRPPPRLPSFYTRPAEPRVVHHTHEIGRVVLKIDVHRKERMWQKKVSHCGERGDAFISSVVEAPNSTDIIFGGTCTLAQKDPVLVARLNSEGRLLWSRQLSYNNSERSSSGSRAIGTSDNTTICVGTTLKPTVLGQRPNVLVIKTDGRGLLPGP